MLKFFILDKNGNPIWYDSRKHGKAYLKNFMGIEYVIHKDFFDKNEWVSTAYRYGVGITDLNSHTVKECQEQTEQKIKAHNITEEKIKDLLKNNNIEIPEIKKDKAKEFEDYLTKRYGYVDICGKKYPAGWVFRTIEPLTFKRMVDVAKKCKTKFPEDGSFEEFE